MIILGGGYKACEFGHFFSAFGTNVSIVGHNPRILPREEEEVGDFVLTKMKEYLNVNVNQDVVSIRKGEKGKIAVLKDRTTGVVEEIEAELAGDLRRASRFAPGAVRRRRSSPSRFRRWRASG